MKITNYETEATREYQEKRNHYTKWALKRYDNEHRCRDRWGWCGHAITWSKKYNERYRALIDELVTQLPALLLIDLSIDGIGYWRKSAVEHLQWLDWNVEQARYLYLRLETEAGNDGKKYLAHYSALWDFINEQYICPECLNFVEIMGEHYYEIGAINWLDAPEERYTCQDKNVLIFD